MAARPSRIEHEALYRAVYEFAVDTVPKEVPLGTLRVGTRVSRTVGVDFAGTLDQRAQRYQTIPPTSSREGEYRWTGPRPDGTPGPSGGLYVALDWDAGLGEILAYHPEPDYRVSSVEAEVRAPLLTPQALADSFEARRTYEYELTQDLRYGDLSLGSGEFSKLLAEFDKSDGVRAALQASGYESARLAYGADRDYSFTRALGHAVRGRLTRLLAIRVTSARTEELTSFYHTGFNLVLLGTDGSTVSYLRPVLERTWQRDPAGRLRERVTVIP